MSIRRRTTAGVIGALLLAGCTADDPNQGGLFGGLIGLGSGAYQQRVDDERAALKAEQARYQEKVDGRQRLDRKVDGQRGRVAELERELAYLERDADALGTEIVDLQDQENVTVQQVAKAEADVASILDDIDRIEAEKAASDEAKALGADAGPDADPSEFGEPPRERTSELRAYIDRLQAAVEGLKRARERQAEEESAPAPTPATD